MQTTNGTSACASCKHQRKKCTEKCVLAPFFPADKTREFQAVHKVFGVSNITKIITSLREEDRRLAVDSLVWEALCRQKEPVLGPYGEYRRVCEELRLYKAQFHQERMLHKAAAAAPGPTRWNCNSNMINVGTNHAGGLNNINNNNNNLNNNNSLNNIHGNGNPMVGFFPYGYTSHHIQDAEKIAVERDDGSPIIRSQQHLTNDFNQQFFLAGQHNQIDSKSMESTLWEGSTSL